VAAHIAKNGTNGGQNGRQYRQARGKTVTTVLSYVLNLVIVWAMNVKPVSRHAILLNSVGCRKNRQREF